MLGQPADQPARQANGAPAGAAGAQRPQAAVVSMPAAACAWLALPAPSQDSTRACRAPTALPPGSLRRAPGCSGRPQRRPRGAQALWRAAAQEPEGRGGRRNDRGARLGRRRCGRVGACVYAVAPALNSATPTAPPPPRRPACACPVCRATTWRTSWCATSTLMSTTWPRACTWASRPTWRSGPRRWASAWRRAGGRGGGQGSAAGAAGLQGVAQRRGNEC